MPIISAAAPPHHFDPTFAKRLVALNIAVPGVILAWDAYRHELGPDGAKFALHTTGLLALVFLLASLAITPLRRFTGRGEVIAVRRTFGVFAFAYLCAHLAIFYGFDRDASLSSTVHEILTRRYLQIGAIAWLLFVPLAATSTRGMVARLGAKRWKSLHRLTYLATSLGALHYYLLVKADVRQPLVFAGVLALLLGTRPVFAWIDARARRNRPRRFWSGKLRVVEVREETHDVRTFELASVDGGAFPFVHTPGQYLNLGLTIGGARVTRSYTIASAPNGQDCQITVKRDGLASTFLHEHVRAGATLDVSAPAGRFVFSGKDAKRVLLIAGGVGITPLMAILRSLSAGNWPGDVHLIVSAHTERDLIFARELAAWVSQSPRLHLIVTLTRADAAGKARLGRIDAALLREVPALEDTPVYLCGPEPMMASMRVLLAELGVPQTNIFTEDFTSNRPRTQATAADEGPITPANGVATVTFRRSLQTVDFSPDQTILEAAEDAGIDLPFECRSGICGQCKVKLTGGRVTMEVQDALSPAEKADGYILSCQARSPAHVEVDA